MSARKLDAIVFSTGRAASTAIYRYLDVAGNLRLPANKEPHFWCDVGRHGGIYPMLRDITVTDADAYWRLYQDSRIALDASVGYFFYIDEVIANLQRASQKPRVIFLYREPAARARSLFNELRRKQLTQASTFTADLAAPRAAGQWWEYYYDNVPYQDAFLAMTEYFDDVLAINYDRFAQDPAGVVARILDFLGVEPVALDAVDWQPVNSSAEAVAATYARQLGPLKRLVPRSLRDWGRRSISARLQAGPAPDLHASLPLSMGQYAAFRAQIHQEDLLCLKK